MTLVSVLYYELSLMLDALAPKPVWVILKFWFSSYLILPSSARFLFLSYMSSV